MNANKPALLRRAAMLVFASAIWASAHGAVEVTIVNTNGPGEGFNDPTPAQPIGGNNGATLGQQRLIAFQHAAGIWGAALTSKVPVRVGASFIALPCTADTAVLGSAGANDIFSDFPNAPLSNTWYPSALASKLAGVDQAPANEPHIRARFNSRLGLFPDCMPGSAFYLGLDNKHGDKINLVTVLLHEMAHGLGFQGFTDEQTGQPYENRPSVWDHHLIDNRTNKLWVNMSNDERRVSALSETGLSWNGQFVTGQVAAVLSPQSLMAVTGKRAGAARGGYEVGDASFGPPLSAAGVKGDLMLVIDQDNGTGLACAPLSEVNIAAVKGNIALVDRGECSFVVKAKHVQDAGAKGMVVADNAPGPVTGLGGGDPAVNIPAVRISQTAGTVLKAALKNRTRYRSGVIANLTVDPDRLAGTDSARRIRMFVPAEFNPGSSVSHFSTDAKSNQLMEPSINADLLHEVTAPKDLTQALMQDIGW